MDNSKILIGIGLLAAAGAVAYFAFGNTGGGGGVPYGATAIPPGGSYGGVTNGSSKPVYADKTGQIMSASGEIIAAAGKATADIMKALNTGGSTAA